MPRGTISRKRDSKPRYYITNAPFCSFCNNYKNNDKKANESLTINTPSLLKDEIVWLFLLRDMCEMFRNFVSTLFYYNNKSRPQDFSGCRSSPSPFTIVVIFLISQTSSNLDSARAGYREVAVRFEEEHFE